MNAEHKYIFSGSLQEKMVDYLLAVDEFEPMDVLVSQLDRSGVDSMLKYMERGAVKSLFIDSGAFSVHSQGFEKVSKGKFLTFDAMVDEYISYVNNLDDKIIAIAQFDHIPGKFKQSKSPEDYVESARLSWENYMYMRPKMKSPEKLIYVFHFGESFDVLDRVLNWRGENGEKLEYLGLSPANDAPVKEKDVYLSECYEHIARSSNPDIKTHLFGYTSLPGLPKFPWYTADSVSHRLRAAYGKIYTNDWGTISVSKKRDPKVKGDMCFMDVSDADTLAAFHRMLDKYHLTEEQVVEEAAARTCIDILQVQEYMRTHPYAPEKKSKKLFSL